ncbi:unnamed protein product [Aureobasidium uvarum]|uniref:Proteinase n=1 Tax=Aureobasidium uvarum TaxID=2773716 RepID=A0A9N8KA11_9PEZI|nr:unnamed protein product [Aureobasidium uvarum]
MFFDSIPAVLLAITHLVQASTNVLSNLQAPTPPATSQFNWGNITATESLVYHDCYGDFQCARLQVPLDWTAEEAADNRTVQIALIKLPASVPVTDSRYGGAVILNPGGPGGSGVKTNTQTIASAGPDADEKTAKYFDIISFDPRGVKHTTPSFRCFPHFLERLTFEQELAAYGLPGSSDTALPNLWTTYRTLADSCSKRAIEAGIGEHMSTTSVARDIVEIVERHGEWREQEASRLLTSSGNSENDLLDHVKYQPGKEMVQYWGVSYGTVLGATLADLYPDRVKRTILDGVVDSFDWYKGGWSTILQDTDKNAATFAEYCWKGGPENCALYHEDGLDSIAQRFSNITKSLLQNPIGVPGTNVSSPDLITHSDLQKFLGHALYGPLYMFSPLAIVMAEIEHGKGNILAKTKRATDSRLLTTLPKECQKDGPYSRACNPGYGGSDEYMIHLAIMCSDAESKINTTKEQVEELMGDLMEQSKMFGDVWATSMIPCTQWHARPKWPYTGHLNATTAHPILFIGNTFDPVTPIRNAYKMSTGFSGSVVLHQDTAGHGSSSGVRAYFQTGELPKLDTTCHPDRVPLDGFDKEVEHPLPEGETDKALWKAITLGGEDTSARMPMFLKSHID